MSTAPRPPDAPDGGGTPPQPPSPVHLASLRAAAADFLRLRPWVVAPGVAVVAGVLALTPMPTGQRVALWCGMGMMAGLFALEAWQLRGRPVGEAAFLRSMCLTALGLSVGCAASGGLQSPLLPLLLAPTVTAFAAFGRGQRSVQVLVLLGVLLAALAALPIGVPFPPLPQPQQRLVLLLCMGMTAALLFLSVSGLSGAFQRTSVRLAQAHEDVLAAAEARALSLEAIGARVAHELKNPLASVKGLVELLAREPKDALARRRFEVVTSEVERIELLVRDYLSFARPLDVLRPAPVDLRRLVEDVVAVLEARAARAGVGLVLEGGDVPLVADARRLREALLNLLGNALEATPPGGQVVLAWRATGEGVCIEVRDTGRGMDAQTLARLGTAFFTTRQEGTGLGVVLARAVAAQHGGSLRHESTPGQGTVARLELPALPPGESHADSARGG